MPQPLPIHPITQPYAFTPPLPTPILRWFFTSAITPLKHLAEQYHLSILLIHHLRKSGATDPMDEISGSTGLTGATDCNMVLQRERCQNNATLHITGRDVEDQELKIAFDPLSGLWSLKASPMAKEISASREAILALLAQKGQPLKTIEIAETLGIEANAVRQRLLQMKKAGQIVSTDRNLYHLPQKDIRRAIGTSVQSAITP